MSRNCSKTPEHYRSPHLVCTSELVLAYYVASREVILMNDTVRSNSLVDARRPTASPNRRRRRPLRQPTSTQFAPTRARSSRATMSGPGPGGPTAVPNDKPYTHVQFDTSIGTFVVELYYRHAPRTCYNMAALAESGYYDGTIFHRIVRDFMVQGGDPTGTGRGGESIFGGKFEDEMTRNLKHTGAGIVSMANAGPNSNGSQFFITLKSTPFLDGKHTIFGRIYSGMGVVQRMGLVPTDDEDRPRSPITIHSARPFREPPPPRAEQQPGALGGRPAHAQITAS